MSASSQCILLVEDSPNDEELTRVALEMAGLKNPVRVARDGAEALDYLLACQPSDLPALVMLDIKLPKMDGFEVLRQIRANESTRAQRVVMLTTSLEPSDIVRSEALGATSYLQKPIDFGEFVESLRKLAREYVSEA